MTTFFAQRIMCVTASVSALFLLLLHGHLNSISVNPTKCDLRLKELEIEENAIRRRLSESEIIWKTGVTNREQAAKETTFSNINHYGRYNLRIIWDFFYPEFTCPHNLERLGRVGDGGKWICGVNQLVRKGNECVVYSYGIEYEITFETEILKRTNCSLYGYDHTIDTDSVPLSRIYPKRATISRSGLGVNNTGPLRTLKSEMDSRGHKFIDVLKLDVEGAEFVALNQIIKDFPNGLPFGQLLIEIHLTSFSQQTLFENFKSWWDELERAGLRAYHNEPNMYNKAGRNQFTTSLYEYSFLNVKTDHVILHA